MSYFIGEDMLPEDLGCALDLLHDWECRLNPALDDPTDAEYMEYCKKEREEIKPHMLDFCKEAREIIDAIESHLKV